MNNINLKIKNLISYLWLLASVNLSVAQDHKGNLEEYIQIASKNNPYVRSQYKKFEAALERIPQAGALADPTLAAGYFILPVETRVGPQQARFSLTQMFPWFGTLAARKDAAALEAEAAYQHYLEARRNLIVDVSKAYYPILEKKQWISIELENIEVLERFRSIALARLRSGEGPMVDVLRIDVSLEEARTNLIIYEDELVPLRAHLNQFLNRPPDEEIRVDDTLYFHPTHLADVPDSLLQGHPAVEKWDRNAQASAARREAAVKSGYPNLGLGLDYVLIGQREEVSLADNGKNALMPMVTLSIPLYRGKYRASIREAELMQESYELEKEGQYDQLTYRYRQVQFELDQQQELIRLYQSQLDKSQRSLELLFSAYENAGATIEELLRMEQQLLSYRKKQISAKIKWQMLQAEWNYLIGMNHKN